MAGVEQVVEFCKAVEEKESAALKIIVVKDFEFWKYALETEDGSVNIVRWYYQYDQNGCFHNRSNKNCWFAWEFCNSFEVQIGENQEKNMGMYENAQGKILAGSCT